MCGSFYCLFRPSPLCFPLRRFFVAGRAEYEKLRFGYVYEQTRKRKRGSSHHLSRRKLSPLGYVQRRALYCKAFQRARRYDFRTALPRCTGRRSSPRPARRYTAGDSARARKCTRLRHRSRQSRRNRFFRRRTLSDNGRRLCRKRQRTCKTRYRCKSKPAPRLRYGDLSRRFDARRYRKQVVAEKPARKKHERRTKRTLFHGKANPSDNAADIHPRLPRRSRRQIRKQPSPVRLSQSEKHTVPLCAIRNGRTRLRYARGRFYERDALERRHRGVVERKRHAAALAYMLCSIIRLYTWKSH